MSNITPLKKEIVTIIPVEPGIAKLEILICKGNIMKTKFQIYELKFLTGILFS